MTVLASYASGAGELRLPLLGEGARSLLGVVRREHGRADLGVVLPAVVLVLALRVPDRPEHGLDGEGAVRGDQVRDLVGLRQRLPVAYDVADQPDLLGL